MSRSEKLQNKWLSLELAENCFPSKDSIRAINQSGLYLTELNRIKYWLASIGMDQKVPEIYPNGMYVSQLVTVQQVVHISSLQHNQSKIKKKSGAQPHPAKSYMSIIM